MNTKVRDNKGIAVVNVILLVLIAISVIFIVLLLTTNNTQIENSTIVAAENVKDRNNVSTTTTTTTVSTPKEKERESNPEVVVTKTGKTNKYYYDQIPQISKSMYDDLLNHKEELRTGTASILLQTKDANAEDYFQTAFDAFDLDNPDIFYLETSQISLVTKSSSNFFGQMSYEYTIKPHDYSYLVSDLSTEDIINAENRINSIVDDIISKCPNGTYNKVKYVHDYIINNCEYNQSENKHNKDLYGVFINKTAVCEGYVKAFKYVLDRLGIPCVAIYGTGINSEGKTEAHAWNAVMMDDKKWYIVDVTWDDPIIIGRGKIPESTKYANFLKGKMTLGNNHKSDGDISGTGQNFIYPTISELDFAS